LSRRRQVLEFPPDCWRRAVLDDVLDADEWSQLRYGAEEAFSLEELRSFAQRWHEDTQDRLKQVIAIAPGPEKRDALGAVRDRLERVFAVLGMIYPQATRDWQAEVTRLDGLTWQSLRDDKRLSLQELIRAVAGLETTEIQGQALYEIAQRIARTELSPAERRELLRLIAAEERLASLIRWDDRFWGYLRDVFPFPEAQRGIAVDLTGARPMTVECRLDLLSAQIVGPVRRGRPALAVYSQQGQLRTLVAGKRRLLFRIAAAGGSIEKYGCRLEIQMQSRQSLHPKLLEVERLDTLAQVDPRQALDLVAGLNLPPDHLIHRTAREAQRDPRQANLLADLLIELQLGIDPDVARHLARIRAREDRYG
jgi:hypothetical protein